MGRKRKAGGRSTASSGPRELDEKDARLGPISTFEDVADSEDEFFINRDKIMLEDEPTSKRRRKDEESDMEFSDEEVLGYDDDDDDDDDDDEEQDEDEDEEEIPKHTKSKKSSKNDDDDPADDDENDEGWWGSSKNEYYNADQIETEADAVEEGKEAMRLQKKKLAKMAEADFITEPDQWLAPAAEDEEEDRVVTEVLKEAEIPEDATAEERQSILLSRYPEFEPLAKEFSELQPVMQSLRIEAKNKPATSLVALKYWVLGCYVASLASYFAILASPARDATKASNPLNPSELRDHDVMETLINCRTAWHKIRDTTSTKHEIEVDDEVMDELLDAVLVADDQPEKKQKKSKKDKAAAKKLAEKAKQAKAIEASVADLYNLKLSNGESKRVKTAAVEQGDNSDFGEEDNLDARTAANKAARKKTLKFYTSQIDQKANKRAGAGRDAGGDMDIPRRERLRDRQARLLAEAEKRGKRGSKFGADLGDDSDGDDADGARALRDDADEYYDTVAQSSKAKKDDKAARYAAYAAASKGDRIVENEEIGEDGKRKINYAIEKNKGLTPRRKKEVRNPRVKKKMQYEAKQKKMRSMKATWKGGEPKGGYSGETSGINTGVIKSVRLG